MNLTRFVRAVAVLVALVVGTVTISCGGGNSSSPTAPTPTQTPTPSPTPTPTRVIGLSGNLAFGYVQVGTSVTATLTISNSGNSTLTWSGLSTGDGVFTASATSGTVAAGGSGTVTLTFTPAAATSYSSTLTVTSDATSGTNTITVSGTGSSTPVAETRVIELSGNLAFGNVAVGSTATQTLTITNSGDSAMTVSGMTSPSGFQPSWVNGTIAAGGSQEVSFIFSPTTAALYSGTLTVIADHTSGTNTTTVSGTGSATPVAETRVMELSGNLAFGNVQVGTSVTTTLTISNSGNSTLTWSGLSTGDGVFTASATSGTVAAGGSGTVTLTFTPAAATSYSSTLTVTSDATSGTNTSTMSGTGTATQTRIISLSGDGNTSDLAFGGVEIGTSAYRGLLIHNSGNSTLTVTGISSSIPNTTFNQPTGTVAAGATGAVTVTFTPLTTDLAIGTVTVTGDQTSGTNTIFGGGWGTVPPTRILGLSGALIFINGSITTSPLEISNTGNATLTVSNIYSDNANVTVNPQSATVAPGGSTSVTVTWNGAKFFAGPSYLDFVCVTANHTNGEYFPCQSYVIGW